MKDPVETRAHHQDDIRLEEVGGWVGGWVGG